ncbi:unnamed protein product, partial [Meganyctiphanes norvegica]
NEEEISCGSSTVGVTWVLVKLIQQEMIDCKVKCGIDMDLDRPDSVATSSNLNNLNFIGMPSLEEEFEFKSFEPLLDPLDVKLMDVTDDNCNNLKTVNSCMNPSSMTNCSPYYDNSIINPSALATSLHNRFVMTEPKVDSNIDNVGVPITASSQITANKPTVFIKADLQETNTTTSNHIPQSQSVKCTALNTQDTVVCSQSILNSSTIGMQQSPLISSQQVSHTMPRNSAAFLINRTDGTPALTGTVFPSSTNNTTATIINRYKSFEEPDRDNMPEERVFPKPAYSYACLVALALKNSTTGSLLVSEIYNFMCEYFPYFRTAPKGWKNSVRHNLSLNKCFDKIDTHKSKGGLWVLTPAKEGKMDQEFYKHRKKDLLGITDAMQYPEVLDFLERGEMKFERGEMKFEASGSLTSCSDDEDDNEKDEEVDHLTIYNTVSILTKQLKKLLFESPNLSVHLNEAAELLKVDKKRLNDISLILEGAGIIYRPKKNYIKWSDFSDIEYLAKEEINIDGLITTALLELIELKHDKDLAYVTRTDLDMTYNDKTVMALKVPPDTTMKVPDDIAEKSKKLYFQSEYVPIQLFLDGVCTVRGGD